MTDESGATQRPKLGTIGVEIESDAPRIATIRLLGECDISTAPQLTDALLRTSSCTNTLLDLSGCDFIDSTIIGVLNSAQHDVDARGGRLAVVVPSRASSVVKRVFELMRLRDVLDVHESVEAARASLSVPPETSTLTPPPEIRHRLTFEGPGRQPGWSATS